MANLRIILLTLSLIATVISTVAGYNITGILNEFPEYSVYNNLLSQTKLNDEINSRQPTTVLVFNNSVTTKFTSDQPLSVVKSALSIHVLLDYFDTSKLENIGDGSMITTTMYQTTGNAAGSTGFVNITDLKGGKVQFRSVASGSDFGSLYTKTVKQMPYNISVLEINSPVIDMGILTGKPPPSVNISSVLERAGSRTFARLITDTGVLKVYETVAAKGLTVFAPSDAAFKAARLPNLNNLSNADLVSLLLYHALSTYVPKTTLMTEKDPIGTLATNSAWKYDLTVKTTGDSVTLSSAVDSSRVVNTVYDLVPICIYTIENVLLPTELFTEPPSEAPAPAPAPASETSPASPSTPAPTPSPKPIASSPAPVTVTPPVVTPPSPQILSPSFGSSPADNPTSDNGNPSDAGDKNKAPVIFLALIIVSVTGIISSIIGV